MVSGGWRAPGAGLRPHAATRERAHPRAAARAGGVRRGRPAARHRGARLLCLHGRGARRGWAGLAMGAPPTKPAHAGACPRECGFAVRAQHSDNMYTHLLGGALNIFIALEPIPPEKGVLWVSPRSHLKGIWPNKENETTAVGHREAVCPPSGADALRLGALQPGDAVCLSVPIPGPASAASAASACCPCPCGSQG